MGEADFQESGSETVNSLFRTPIDAACCALGLVEMLATVARKCTQAGVEPGVVEGLVENIRADFAAFRVVPMDEARIVTATELALRYRLRAMDALHLACALSLRQFGEVVLVSADSELLAAASQAGLTALNPSHMPSQGR